ncbi:Ig-like domain-containing protein [Ferrimonas balearica]|uniref:Ig-like domain-containing protein n=1 Tax=Ferrimonas balearica TaxID=44012 RepID=UPI0021BD04EF|nr:Ig-like domain-containing protein [Ferrimonas balearica]
MKPRMFGAPHKALSAAILLSLLAACGSDNNDAPVPTNTPPVANPVEAGATMGSNTLIDALANDTDADGDALTLESVTLSEGPGTASIHNNQILFKPEEVGVTILEYRISDGNGGEASSTVTISVSAQVLSYVGSEACLSCHTDKESYLETGHNFKLTKVEGEEPQYPFTSIGGSVDFLEVDNTLGNPNGWQDISYVIGGYKSSAMFIDQNGYIMAGSKAGTGLAPKGENVNANMIWPYHAGDTPDSHGFDYCGRCHTTGWRDTTTAMHDERNPDRQDDMPGMGGTFAMTGIQCEACHGAGSAHIQRPTTDNIVKNAEARTTEDYLADDMGFGKAIACSECHTVDDALKRYPEYVSPKNDIFGGDSQGGRMALKEGRRDGRGGRHAADTLIGTDPDTGEALGVKKNFACSTCHNPHKSEHYQDQPGHEGAMVRQCTDCHSMEFADASGGGMAAMAHDQAQCIDCHMPGSSHMFGIDISTASDDASHYSADGLYNKPWLRAYDSCQGCHQEDYDARAARMVTIHQ